MKLLLSELPETHEQTALWLERQIVGMELSQLVTELAAVHNATRPRESVRSILSGELNRVLQEGLRCLPQEKFRQVLLQPFYLFELQELVFSYGGEYWRQKESETDLKQRVEADWRRLKAALPPDTKPLPLLPTRKPWLIPSVAALLLGAILGFVACYLWLNGPDFPPKPRQQTTVPPPVASTAWGWNKPDAVAPAATPKAYLERLATLAEEWKTVVPPADAPNRKLQLLIRLLELRAGCTRLSETNHPIPADQQKLLKAKAVKWCKKIDLLTTNTQDLEEQKLSENMPFIERFIETVVSDLRSGQLTPN
jgi:hypothetical protein